MDQVPLPIVIGIDETWEKKGSHGTVCFSHPGAGYEKVFVPLNSASVSVEYNQILQSCFGEQGGVL